MRKKSKKTVVIALLGTTLDKGFAKRRWQRWRPSVGLCQQDDLQIDRFELLRQERFADLGQGIAADIAQVSPQTQVQQHGIEMEDPWDFEEVYQALYDFAKSYPFDPEKEDYLIHISTGTHVAQICLFLLAESRHLPGRLVQTSPPDRESRPARGEIDEWSMAGSTSIIDLDLSKYDGLAARFADERRAGLALLTDGISTRNAAFKKLVGDVEQVAVAGEAPILLAGPTGSGKTRLARRIYELKKRKNLVDGPFVEVNCATLRGDTAMSTLFGHRKGAFTGAMSDRDGLLLRADGGVLFLDEIGELGVDEQAMLLRAIEDHCFTPLGADTPVLSDFQLVAGTNVDLTRAVSAGTFREDLLARIDVWHMTLPALVDRREDIEPNIDYELQRHGQEAGRAVHFSAEARKRYLQHALRDEMWAGNFRALSASVQRLCTLAAGGRIDLDLVEDEIVRLKQRSGGIVPKTDDDSLLSAILGPALAEVDLFDRVQLAAVIRVCRASKALSEAGRLLFAASRGRRRSVNDSDRLAKYLKKFNLSWQDVQDGVAHDVPAKR